MAGNYWAKFTNRRVSRRHAIAATGSVAAAAAFLAACGGDDDDSGGSGGSSGGSSSGGSSSGGSSSGSAGQSGLLANPTDDSGDRKRGGEINTPILNIGTATLEQSLGGNGAGSPLVHLAHSQLMRAKIGTFNDTPQGEWEPEFAESYEQSADGLQVTFKLRGMKFDDRPPRQHRGGRGLQLEALRGDQPESARARQ
jgi:ABC-type transport system substrate-binding protein